MKRGRKILIRTSATLLYSVFFIGTYLGLQIFFANPSTIQDSHEYNTENKPEYFPVLVIDKDANGTETIVLRSLARQAYSESPANKESSWRLFNTTGAASLAHSHGVSYIVTPHSQHRLQVEVNVSEANGQHLSRYTYEIAEDRVFPRSHLILSSFGENFSPIPFLMIFTGLIIFLSEKFLVKRMLSPLS